MGILKNIVVGVLVAVPSYFLFNVLSYLLIAPNPPKIEEVWWGAGDPAKEDQKIQPFKINISDQVLEDLQYRLEHTRYVNKPLVGINQEYGLSEKLSKEIIHHWKTNYKWREREKFLNTLPQFTTSIQGLQIHFVHIKPKNVPKRVKVLPLLILHGWPGSVREFYDLAPILTTPTKERDIVFELVMPYIPGYGFSESTSKPGLGSAEAALIFKNLMHRLGHEKFYIQGGDMGGIILNFMSVMYPENVLGFHNNIPEDEHRIYPLGNLTKFLLQEMGYLHMQASKPESLGIAMDDSPAGLASYHLEKVMIGTNFDYVHLPDGGLTQKYKMDDILDTVMIYWVTGCATTAYRMYAETFNMKSLHARIIDVPIKIPTACARFKYDFLAPDGIIRDIYQNLLQVRDYDGGHFPAMEQPQLLAKDIFDAVEKFQKFHSKKNKRKVY